MPKTGASKSVKTRSRAVRSPEATRRNLVEAAKVVFAARGFHGASVHDIASEANVSTAMINHHFGGKEGLYRASIGDFAERRLQAIEKYVVAPRNRDDFITRLELLVTELLDLHLADRLIVTVLL